MDDLRLTILRAIMDTVNERGLDFGMMATIAAERVQELNIKNDKWIYNLNEGR